MPGGMQLDRALLPSQQKLISYPNANSLLILDCSDGAQRDISITLPKGYRMVIRSANDGTTFYIDVYYNGTLVREVNDGFNTNNPGYFALVPVIFVPDCRIGIYYSGDDYPVVRPDEIVRVGFRCFRGTTGYFANKSAFISAINQWFSINNGIVYNEDERYGKVVQWNNVDGLGGTKAFFIGSQGTMCFSNKVYAANQSGESGSKPGTPDPSTDPDPDNPYEPGEGGGGTSGTGGGGGSFNGSSDSIGNSSLPSLSMADTGFTRLYNPSLKELQNLARYMWTDGDFFKTFWNHIKQFIEDPMQAIIGLNIVPVPVPEAGKEDVAILFISTGVSMTKAASQFVDRDCGTLKLEPYYGSALDYSPYTKVSCYLPYIGTVPLDTDEVMGRTLHVTYRVDICSGECVAKIMVDGSCLYQFAGNCAINVPISQAGFSSYVSAVLGLAGAVVGFYAGGAAGAAAVGLGANAMQQTGTEITTTETVNTERNPATGRQVTSNVTRTSSTTEKSRPASKASFAGMVSQNVNNTVAQVMSAKEVVAHSGTFSGSSGYLGIRRPYLIIKRPRMCLPSSYRLFNGYPSMITMKLDTCSGFTQVQQVQLTGIRATNPEKAEILELLKSGVIF